MLSLYVVQPTATAKSPWNGYCRVQHTDGAWLVLHAENLIYEFVIQCAATTRSPGGRASKFKSAAISIVSRGQTLPGGRVRLWPCETTISTPVTWTLIWLVSDTYIGYNHHEYNSHLDLYLS